MAVQSSSESTDSDRPAASVTDGVQPIDADTRDLPCGEPMTLSLFGKLFGVPFLIISAIVGGAVVVVVLFGGPAAPQQRSIESLMQTLEASSGAKAMGLLMPREKQLWQTALELSVRLDKKGGEPELTGADLRKIAVRLGEMVQADLAAYANAPDGFIPKKLRQRQVRSRRLEFLIHALGRTERVEAIDPLLAVLRGGYEPYAAVAMQELGRLRALPQTREAIDPIVEILATSTRAETLLMACTVLSVLAEPGDQRVLDALAATRLTAEGEVEWSAALALARLGSDAGKSTLLELCDRSFLESGEHYTITDSAGNVRRYALPAQRVDELLMAVIDAASNLDDADVWGMIQRLGSDPSPAVRAKAAATLKTRTG